VSFLKTTPTNIETARHFGPPIWLLLVPKKNTGVQVPPLKSPETLAVPTVPPFFEISHTLDDGQSRQIGVVDWRLRQGTAIDLKWTIAAIGS